MDALGIAASRAQGAAKAVGSIVLKPVVYGASAIARRLGWESAQDAARHVGQAQGAAAAARQGGSEFSQALAQNLATPGPFTFIRS